MFNILVVEDDARLCRLMSTVLTKNGYHAFTASDGNEAFEIMDREHIDLIISDIMMPGMDGYTLVEALREADYTLPILFVTAKDSFSDKERGFLVGIDDYMVKPIDVNELILRVGAILRRSRIIHEHKITFGSTTLDYDSFTVTIENEEIPLPKKEFLLLYKLLFFPGQIFTRQQLMDEIWGMDSEAEERTVDVHIQRLRKRFSSSSDFDIITIRGLGYKAVRKA